MILVLSPAKTLNEDPIQLDLSSEPRLQKQAFEIIQVLQKKSKRQLMTMMKINDKLADLNVDRYKSFSKKSNTKSSKQAGLLFQGDVYRGLQAELFNKNDLKFAQKHVRILSGLYGLLRPLDMTQPYRLEMGTSLTVNRKKGLYKFWDDRITDLLNADLKAVKGKVLLNLASAEYFKSVLTEKLDATILTCDFREKKGKDFKFMSFYAKKARGLMAHYVVKNRVKKPEDLKHFDLEGYAFNKSLSTENKVIS